MLFVTDRQTVVLDSVLDKELRSNVLPLSAAYGYTSSSKMSFGREMGRYGYLFETASGASSDPRTSDALDSLAAAMEQDTCRVPSGIASVFSLFAQFVENDISAPADMIAGISETEALVLEPLLRKQATHGMRNMRNGRLSLASVYGDPYIAGNVSQRVRSALSCPENRAKLRIGELAPSQLGHIPIPTAADAMDRDLPRLGAILGDPNAPLSLAHLESLSPQLDGVFGETDSSARVQRAIIADFRNDANLPLAQFHLVWLRLHNRIVDELSCDMPGAPSASLYVWARQRLRWHYQWLVLYALLPAVCDRAALAQVMKRGPVLYRKLAATSNGAPLPLEFCAAAFRFGQLTMRESYDWNRVYGRNKPVGPHFDASLDLLFRMTGNGPNPMSPSQELGSAPALPAHWPIEWDRFVYPIGQDNLDHAARAIGPRLQRSVHVPCDEAGTGGSPLDGMARADLRRGLRMNLPSGQDCIALLRDQHGIELPELCGLEICSGGTGNAVRDGHFEDQTPLWFYILKEAEVLGEEGRLGPLGTQIVADTLLGLVVSDPESFWHVRGRSGRWAPQDGVRVNGVEINSMPALMQAAGLLPVGAPAPT